MSVVVFIAIHKNSVNKTETHVLALTARCRALAPMHLDGFRGEKNNDFSIYFGINYPSIIKRSIFLDGGDNMRNRIGWVDN